MFCRTCVLLGFLLAACPAARAAADGADEAAFRQRNAAYIQAFLKSDVGYFERALAEDFIAVLADGRAISKTAFLHQVVIRPDAEDLRLRDVAVRVFTDSAVVVAEVGYHRADGTPVVTRYSTLYVRHGSDWLVEWVQWTRVAAP